MLGSSQSCVAQGKQQQHNRQDDGCRNISQLGYIVSCEQLSYDRFELERWVANLMLGYGSVKSVKCRVIGDKRDTLNKVAVRLQAPYIYVLAAKIATKWAIFACTVCTVLFPARSIVYLVIYR